jgi:hypothetical protein
MRSLFGTRLLHWNFTLPDGFAMLGLHDLLYFELRRKLPITGTISWFPPSLSSELFLAVGPFSIVNISRIAHQVAR